MTQLDISDVKSLNEYILIIGDWKGSNNLINSKSTLGIGMKRLLRKYFKKMYLINEINTSKISNLTHKETKNYVEIMRYNGKKPEKLGDQKVINKRIHEILTFTMYKKHISCKILYNDDKEEKENGEVLIRRFIQRDKNAVLNFKYLTEYYLKYKTRPIEYTIKKINNAKK